MLRSGYWLTEYLSISSVLKSAPAQYSRAFLYTETDDADLGYFVNHQLTVIEKAVEGLHGYLARKTSEQRQAETLLPSSSPLAARLNHRQRALLLNALRELGRQYRIAGHQQALQVTYQTARTDLLNLANAGLMNQQKIGSAFVFEGAPNVAERLRSGK